MKIMQKLIAVLIACQLLAGCNNKDSNPLNQMPVKQAAKLLLSATKASNNQAGLPQSGETYLLCLGHKLETSACQNLYGLMAEHLKAQGLAITKNSLTEFAPAEALKKELQYQALIDDED